MQAFQRDLGRFEKLNAQVLGVSPDSLDTHREFSRKYDITFPLIADDNGEVQKLYAPGRVTFVIDEKGEIRFVQKGVPNNRELLRQLEQLSP